MQRYSVFVLLIVFFPLGSALDVSISCPNTASYLEEISCEIDVDDVIDVYDVKVYITGDDGMINHIFDGSAFRRSDWYVPALIDDDGTYTVRLLFYREYDGDATGEFKLRDAAGNIDHTELFTITMHTNSASETDESDDDTENDSENTDDDTDDDDDDDAEDITTDGDQGTQTSIQSDQTPQTTKVAPTSFETRDREQSLPSPATVINLHSQEELDNTQTVYQSKQERIQDMMLYAFIVFLIVIIGILLFERRWYVQS